MRVFSIPAKYAPAVEKELRRLIERVQGHAFVTDGEPDYPGRLGFFADDELDPARAGKVVILMGDLPDDDKVVALPLQRHLRAS